MYKNITRKLSLLVLVITAQCTSLSAQVYTVNKNTHSHNDYLQGQPFYLAHANHFGSMEIDVYLVGNDLFVAHNKEDIDKKRTIESLYLEPLIREIKLNGNHKPYKDGGHLQLLIDLKTAGEPALRSLEQKLKPIRQYFDTRNNPDAVKLVITGSTPPPDRFKEFSELFFFDGKREATYTPEQLKRVAFFSVGFHEFSKWNGLGRMVPDEYTKAKSFVDSVHAAGKQVRFWGNPDTKTCWQAFIKMGVDFLNTDSPGEMAKFLNTYPDNSYSSVEKYKTYQPTYQTDNNKSKPKNVILLISDGAGFSQFWAAATANGGELNATHFKHIGYSNTAPENDYNTDSAAGATAMATGEKTNNRYIGMDSTGNKIPNLPEMLAKKGVRSGIISNDRVTGATPSSFFAHRTERDQSDSIASDLQYSPASLIVGGSHEVFNANQDNILNSVKKSGFEVIQGVDKLAGMDTKKRILCFDTDRPADNYRLIENAFDESVKFLSADPKRGFFLMVEGAKIDGGGHLNKIKQCIDEYLSFDKVIGKALKFADSNRETLVIVSSDHETGGLILYDGNYTKGTVLGTFTTNDHTGLPVPLFSYGPGSEAFTGFLQNADIPKRIIAGMK